DAACAPNRTGVCSEMHSSRRCGVLFHWRHRPQRPGMTRNWIMKNARISRLGGCLFLFAALQAQVPQLINFQGRIAVDGVNFNGTGLFKFALVNGDGRATYWSNDGTSANGNEPSNAVSIPVAQGLYSVLLGDPAFTNMTPVPATLFTNSDVRLRI